jgi:hypothetical protein
MTVSPIRSRKLSTLLVGLSLIALGSAVAGCSGAPATEAPPKAAASAPVTQPDLEKARAHLKEHVKYPATRAEVLAACADTPEFTPSENAWFSDHLPDGSYASADEVLRSLKM